MRKFQEIRAQRTWFILVIHNGVSPFACSDTGTVLAASLPPQPPWVPWHPSLGLEFAVFLLMDNIFSVTLAELCELSLLAIKGASPQQGTFSFWCWSVTLSRQKVGDRRGRILVFVFFSNNSLLATVQNTVLGWSDLWVLNPKDTWVQLLGPT